MSLQFAHVRCFACLQRHVAKRACRLFYCWTLLRNNNMATNLDVFASSYGRRHFSACERWTEVMQGVVSSDSGDIRRGDYGPLGQNLHFCRCNPCCLPQVGQSWFPKSAKGPHYFSAKKEPKSIITSAWLHFKNCWKSGPKVLTLRDQWPMAKGPLEHVVLSCNFMTIITDNKQIFVYLQWEMKRLLIYHDKEKR